MEPLRVYPDTSVFGGLFDGEFAALTAPFFRAVQSGRIVLLVSDLVVAELDRAPARIQDLLQGLLPASERVVITAAMRDLQVAYLAAGVVGSRYADDALHVAAATVVRAQTLVSWNFRHLVDPRRARRYNGVNIGRGYGLVTIVTPVDLALLPETEDEGPEA